ncbi:hypothetical protein FJT64_009671 [Amphibalanus amphitrite]|uniref:Uncharacterized protein n=1 Tax=Amphibalanus amphitrite TaxID=1232801 RepID=A0A6A4VLU5_AMPAM|nr:hypothetical protein FJT64_009671 [Amphibalanus amphitrite]
MTVFARSLTVPSTSVCFQGSLCPACVAHSMDCPNGSGASSGFGNGCSSGGGGVNGCSSGVSTVSGSGRIAGEPPSSAVSRSTILTKAKPFPVMGWAPFYWRVGSLAEERCALNSGRLLDKKQPSGGAVGTGLLEGGEEVAVVYMTEVVSQ